MNLTGNNYVTRAIVGFAFALTLFGSQWASATHLIHHRYTVWGEVRYEDGTPATGVNVQILVKDEKPIGEVKTDRNGRYRIILHVHNEDMYKIFDMRANNVTRKVRLLFNPNDLETERGQRVDLIVKRESGLETSSILSN